MLSFAMMHAHFPKNKSLRMHTYYNYFVDSLIFSYVLHFTSNLGGVYIQTVKTVT